MTSRARTHLEGFLAALTASGFVISPLRRVDFFRALTFIDLISVEDIYWAARVTLIADAYRIPEFDAIFDAWFRDGTEVLERQVQPDEETTADRPPENNGDMSLPPADMGEGQGKQANADEILWRHPAPQTGADKREICRSITRAADRHLLLRRSRRMKPARKPGVLDLRRTLQSMLRNGGDAVQLAFRERPLRPRRVVMLIDISGSLKATSADALRAAHAVMHSSAPVEVFTFGTRLTRVTKALKQNNIDRALAQLSDIIFDFDGGTRIGESFAHLLDDSRYTALIRGAVVFVVSDGLERGDVAAMADATWHFARLAHRLVWLTPLMGDAHYRPVTRGMQAVLPMLDRLGDASMLESFLTEIRALDAEVEKQPRRQAVRNWSAGAQAHIQKSSLAGNFG